MHKILPITQCPSAELSSEIQNQINCKIDAELELLEEL